MNSINSGTGCGQIRARMNYPLGQEMVLQKNIEIEHATGFFYDTTVRPVTPMIVLDFFPVTELPWFGSQDFYDIQKGQRLYAFPGYFTLNWGIVICISGCCIEID